MDWNYRSTAKTANFVIDGVRGDDLTNFPIERARVRFSEIIVFLRAASVIAYGWTLQRKVVRGLVSLLASTRDEHAK